MIQIPQEQLEQRWDDAPDEIRDAIFSDSNGEELEKIGKIYLLTREQEKGIAYVCLVAFLGFISTKDVFEELRGLLDGNTKSSYDIYSILDQRIFSPLRPVVQQFYESHKKESATPTDIIEQNLEEKVDLKKVRPAEDFVNLRPQTPADSSVAPRPVTIQAEAGPMQAATIEKSQLFSPHTLRESWIRTPSPGEQLKIKYPVPDQTGKPNVHDEQSRQAGDEPSKDEGPVILHKKEESVPIAQIDRFKEYKNPGAGGFLGAFGNVFLKKQQEQQAPRASVEIPGAGFNDKGSVPKGQEKSDVPITVKKFGDGQKTVHYSDFKTYISRRDEV